MEEPFLTNPPRHHGRRLRLFGRMHHNPFRRHHRRAHHRRNPGELMFVGANPFHKGVRSMAKRHKRRYRHNDPGRRHHRRHYRHNPMMAMGTLMPMVVGGTLGIAAERVLSKMVGMTGIMNYGVKAAIALGGGWAVGKYVNKPAGEGWMIGAVSAIVVEALNELAPTLGLGGMLAEQPQMLTYYTPAAPATGAFEQPFGAFEQAAY